MSRVTSIIKTLRNNWKKSVFFAGLSGWAVSYARRQYIELNLMREFCEEARAYGQEKLHHLSQPRHVTVLLNPTSNKGKGRKDYDQYVQPLLHLAGLKVSLVLTEAEGQAKDLMEIMNNTDCVLIAGGDGTVHEAITGILRRKDWYEASRKMPIGIVPIGRQNRIACKLNRKHFDQKSDTRAKMLAQSTMLLVRQVCSDVDVVKVEGESGRPVYFLDRINLGQINATLAKLDEYWYLGNRMKPYLTLFFQSWKDLSKEWNEEDAVKITYSDPCPGCSKCYHLYVPPEPKQIVQQTATNQKWWHFLLPRSNLKQAKEPQTINKPSVDFEAMKSVVNDACDVQHSIEVNAKNIIIENEFIDDQRSQLNMIIHPDTLSRKQFVTEGIRLSKGQSPTQQPPYLLIKAKELTIEVPPKHISGGEEEDNVPQAIASTEAKISLEETIEYRPNAIKELDAHESTDGNEIKEETNKEDSKEDNKEDSKKLRNLDARWISIDNEYFELQSKLKISLLPHKVLIYH